jgi:hypothetical protein
MGIYFASIDLFFGRASLIVVFSLSLISFWEAILILLSPLMNTGDLPPCPGSGINLYRDLFNAFNLIDIVPVKLAPTWRNGRRGTEAIAKRLDRFLLSDALFSSSVSPTSRVVLPFLSDHAPILLTLNLPFRFKPFPFKYNHHWADFPDFTALVHSVWSDQRFLSEANPQLRIAWKLNPS